MSENDSDSDDSGEEEEEEKQQDTRRGGDIANAPEDTVARGDTVERVHARTPLAVLVQHMTKAAASGVEGEAAVACSVALGHTTTRECRRRTARRVVRRWRDTLALRVAVLQRR